MQTLLTAIRKDDYELSAQVDEADVNSIAVGDTFTVTFEELDIAPVEASVTSISPLGNVSGGESTYTVRLSFVVPEGVWPGMHAVMER